MKLDRNIFKKWIFDNLINILFWTIAIIFVIWNLYPLLSAKVVAGWDLTSHLYLLQKMVDFLKEGHITGYDTKWFGGYPAFTFYAPLIYVIMAIPNLLSFGLIPLPFLFNLFLFLLPIFFLATIFYTARKWIGNRGGYISLVFGLFFLSLGKGYAYFGIGISSMMYAGLINNLFGISLMVLLLGVLHPDDQKRFWPSVIKSGIILGIIILSHTLTTIFTGIILAILALCYWNKLLKRIILTGIIGILIGAFWLLPFLLYLEYSSGLKIGLMTATSDPLFILYPLLDQIIINPGIYLIPTILLAISSMIGIFTSIKSKNYFWPVAFILTLIVLPREYLINILNTPIHYYRFISHIFVLNIFVATGGVVFLVEKIDSIKKIVLQSVSTILIYFMLLFSIFICFAEYYDLTTTKDTLHSFYDNTYHYFFDEYPSYASAMEMVDYIAKLSPKGRIATESSVFNQINLGSPHFFLDVLPLEKNIAVVPGLLVESSISSEFIIPPLTSITNSMPWGNISLLFDKSFIKQNKSGMLKKLEQFNVEYILLANENAKTLLDNKKTLNIDIEKQNDGFTLIKLKSFQPLFQETTAKPFLYIDKGGMDFLNFAKEWYKSEELSKFLVIHTDKKWEQISDEEKNKIGGIIVNYPAGTKPDSMDDLNKYDKKLIILNVEPSVVDSMNDDLNFIPYFDVNIGTQNLAEVLGNFTEKQPEKTEIIPKVNSDEYLEFSSGNGVLINYSYFPRWKSKDQNQTVYWIAPTMMFVFGNGANNELYYD